MKSPSKNSLLSKILKALLAAAFILSITACPPATGGDPDLVPGPENKDPEPTKVEQLLLGTWAYDYGYDQEKFAEETLTLNKDKTLYIDAKYYYSNTFEIDKGTYEIVNDSVYGQTLKLHITQYKDGSMQDFSDCNAIISFKCTFDDDDTLHLDRFKQDFSNQGGAVNEFDPVKENTYYRIKDGTKEILTSGKWRVNKIGTPDCDWDEEWTFNADGTMKDVWTEADCPTGIYNGTYEVIDYDGKNVLHHTLDCGETTPEWWYEYKSYGPNLISVQLIKSTLAGEVSDATVNYYYREVETETFNYHVGIGTFKHMVPKADSYKLVNHPWQLNQLSSVIGYEFLGWYDNKNFTGNPVSTVTDNKRDFYAKFNLVTMYETYENNDGSIGSDYYLGYPAIFVLNDEKELQLPEPGDNISILFEATLTEDIDGEVGMIHSIYDNGWKRFSFDYKNIKTSGKKIREVFNFTVPDNITLSDYLNDYCIIFYYLEEGRNKANTFSDWKYTILDDTDSYKITYNFGDVSYVARGLKDSDFELPKDSNFFEHINWNIAQSIEILGWYENEDFSGNEVTSIPAGNTADKTYYAKINLKGRRSGDWEDNGKMNHDYHVTVPVKALVPGNEFNPKPGDTVNIYFEATLSNDLNQWAGWHLQSDNGWIARDVGPIVTSDKKLSKIFTIKIDDNVTLPSVDELYFDFWYSKEAYDGIITFSDWKFVLLDETNSYKITYNFGDVSYVARGLKDSDFELAKSESNFSHLDWRFDNFELLGWYDNPELTGTPVTSIPAGNTAEKTYYAKFNLRIRGKNMFDDGKNYNYPIDVPLKSVLSGVSFNPKPGDTISIYFEATFKNDLDGWASVGIVDATNGGWRSIAGDGRDIKTTNKKMKEVFSMKINSNETLPTDINNYGFNFCYNPDACDDTNIISDWKIVLLDETNSYNIAYKWGDVEYRTKGYKEIDFALPENAAFFDNFDWRIAQQELLGWYDNPELTGTPVTSISKGNTSDKTYYAKFNFKGRLCEWEENGEKKHDYHTTVPVRTLLPETKFNPKPGDTYNILFEATLSHDFNQWAGLQLQTNDGKHFQDFGNIVTQNKKLSKVFTIKIDADAELPSVDELYFDFWYSKEACDEIVTFSDWKFILLDETNSYNIVYHYGNFSSVVKGLSVEDYNLPETSIQLSTINERFAEPEFLGWYDNPNFTGTPVTSIGTGNMEDKEFWMKYNFRTCKREWDTAEGTKDHHWSVEIPLETVMPDFDVSKLKPDTNIKVKVTATPAVSSFSKYFLRIVDVTNNGWKDIAWTEESEVIVDNKISHIFNLYVDTDASTSALKDILFGIGYAKESYDQPITISDWKFEFIE